MKMRIFFILSVVLLLSAACAPKAASRPATVPATAQAPGAPDDWQTYANPLGFAIRYPSAWTLKELPQQSGETSQTVVLQGSEGSVALHWGVGFGGACPQGYTTVKVAEGELSTCYALLDDGTEVWAQINKPLEATSFSADARTANADPASHDLVLQVVSTLSFPPPEQDAEQSPAGAAVPAGAVSSLQPLTMEVCDGQAQAMAHALDVLEVTQSEEPISDPATGASGTGCQVTATGTGEQFESPDAAVNALGSMLVEQGWQKDPMLEAGGPTGMGAGFRKDNQVCLAGAIWHPDAAANCPEDQPISTCQVAPEQQLYTVTLNCAQSAAGASGAAGIANPASVNCVEQGGTLSFEERGDGGQYGICLFEDNRQCEEWALLRGDCPVGGLKVTGYATPAARYCAITGGSYAITGNSGADDEQGTCTFKDSRQCDACAYYDGTCDASTAEPAASAASPRETTPQAAITDSQVITYAPGPPAGEPREGSCWTNSLAVWREDAWRCSVGNDIYDPCFVADGSVICGASPVTTTASFALTLSEPLPAPEPPQDTTGHAWLVELADGTVCEFATGATGGVGDERINYFCPSSDADQTVVILGDLQPGEVYMAHRAVLTGNMPDLTVLESAQVPIRTLWR